MRDIEIITTDKSIIVFARHNGSLEKIDWINYKNNKRKVLKVTVPSEKSAHKLLQIVNLHREGEDEGGGDGDNLVIYTGKKSVHCYKHVANGESPLKRLVSVDSKVLFVTLTRNHLHVLYYLSIVNPYALHISNTALFVDDRNVLTQKLRVALSLGPSKISKLAGVRYAKFKTSNLVEGEDIVNLSTLKVAMNINGDWAQFNLKMPSKKIKKTQFYYVPLTSLYYRGYALHVRRTSKASVMLVRRHMEKMEYNYAIRFLESKPVGFIMYGVARLARKVGRSNVNVFFEKFSAKAEEGAFDVFKRAQEVGTSRNYFLIDKDSKDYPEISSVDGVLKKHSFLSYWALFRANYLISTEAPGHATFFRSNNKYLRKSLLAASKPFIFLQHGVTFLKRQGKKSSFVAGKEAEPTLIVASGKKEAKAINRTMKIPKSRILEVGLPIFDKIRYCHIDNHTPGVVTVMYTWKPYEEHLDDFTKSTYYLNTMHTFDLVAKYIGASNVRIIPHPKVLEAMKKTGAKASLWDRPISDALNDTKVMITDYSSICYNSFYQGAGVIFFQPDLQMYEKETGKLIPKDDEYIGPRCFSYDDLNSVLASICQAGDVDISFLREEKYLNRYLSINEFHDGRNIDRLCTELTRRNIL